MSDQPVQEEDVGSQPATFRGSPHATKIDAAASQDPPGTVVSSASFVVSSTTASDSVNDANKTRMEPSGIQQARKNEASSSIHGSAATSQSAPDLHNASAGLGNKDQDLSGTAVPETSDTTTSNHHDHASVVEYKDQVLSGQELNAAAPDRHAPSPRRPSSAPPHHGSSGLGYKDQVLSGKAVQESSSTPTPHHHNHASVDFKDQVLSGQEMNAAAPDHHSPSPMRPADPTVPPLASDDQHAGSLQYKDQVAASRGQHQIPATDPTSNPTAPRSHTPTVGSSSPEEDHPATARAVFVHAVHVADDDDNEDDDDEKKTTNNAVSLRRMMMQVMVAALCLNTILAAAIVAGAFCILEDACSRGGGEADGSSTTSISESTPLVPTAVPTPVPFVSTTTTTTAVPSLPIVIFPPPVVAPLVPAPTPFVGSPPPWFVGPAPVTVFFPPPPVPANPEPFQGFAPTPVPDDVTAFPTPFTASAADVQRRTSTVVPILVSIAVLAECLILAGSYAWFRRSRNKLQNGDETNEDDTLSNTHPASTTATLSSPPPPPPKEASTTKSSLIDINV